MDVMSISAASHAFKYLICSSLEAMKPVYKRGNDLLDIDSLLLKEGQNQGFAGLAAAGTHAAAKDLELIHISKAIPDEHADGPGRDPLTSTDDSLIIDLSLPCFRMCFPGSEFPSLETCHPCSHRLGHAQGNQEGSIEGFSFYHLFHNGQCQLNGFLFAAPEYVFFFLIELS